MVCDDVLHGRSIADSRAEWSCCVERSETSEWVERFLEGSPKLLEAEAVRVRKLLEYMGR